MKAGGEETVNWKQRMGGINSCGTWKSLASREFFLQRNIQLKFNWISQKLRKRLKIATLESSAGRWMRIGCPETQPPWIAICVRTVVSHDSDGKFNSASKWLPAAKPFSHGTNHPLPSTINEYGIVSRGGATIGFPLRLSKSRAQSCDIFARERCTRVLNGIGWLLLQPGLNSLGAVAGINCILHSCIVHTSFHVRRTFKLLRDSIRLTPNSPPCVTIDNFVSSKGHQFLWRNALVD